MSMEPLTAITCPEDVRKLRPEKLPRLAQAIRGRIIETTSRNGGHLASNLGVVELTIALHRAFETPRDALLFDVSHQGYAHKLLTGRQGEGFTRLRQSGGLAGFLSRAESPHDAFGAGHAGTALSAALGLAVARDLRNGNEHVAAVIGDASLTCGITWEAFNNLSINTRRLIVILNDNEWSISKNVGALANYLNDLITNPFYNRLDRDVKSAVLKLPGGERIVRAARKWKRETKDYIVPSSIFESFGMRYLGPVDGHDFEVLEKNLDFAKRCEMPVLLHVLTQKGKGYPPAEKHPERFHGTGPFDADTGKKKKPDGSNPVSTYQEAFGKALLKLARADPDITAVTAAMTGGTGLRYIREKLPRQFFDVGIAEEHAVIFAAGMAAKGFKPVVAIYSTFLQRSFDPIMHDVCLQNLPVVFCLDRAGLSPGDGPTHHGLYDIAYLRCLPNAVIMQPKDEDELSDMLWTGLRIGRPAFIRYPRGNGTGAPLKRKPEKLETGQAEVLRPGEHLNLWALGPWTADALELAERLETETDLSVGVVNARFVKPLDRELLLRQAEAGSAFVTFEDHTLTGGFGSAVLEAFQSAGCQAPVECVGWPDRFILHGTGAAVLRAAHGLSRNDIFQRLLAFTRRLPHSIQLK